MIRSRHGLKALCLCGLVLGLMAISAGAAQAEKGANWMVNGTNVNGTLLPELQVKEIENADGILLAEAGGGVKVSILCKKATLVGVRLRQEGGVDQGKVVFHECVTLLNGKLSTPCEPHTGATKGLVETKLGEGLLVLVGGVPVTLLKPVSGTVLTVIELGEECSVGEKTNVEGELNLKDCKNEIAVEKTEHLVEEGPGTSLTAFGRPAKLDGSAIVVLTGAPHVGLKWSGLPA